MNYIIKMKLCMYTAHLTKCLCMKPYTYVNNDLALLKFLCKMNNHHMNYYQHQHKISSVHKHKL